jgi:ribose transport system substrate-binding protein
MKNLILALLALCATVLFQRCGKNDNVASEKKFRIAIVPNVSNEFWSMARHGCDLAADALGNVDVDFCEVTNSTVESQQNILSNLVASGVDGIAVSPISPEKQAAFLDQIAAKTLLVCMDSDAAERKRACFIGTDNVAAGRQAADLIKSALPQGGKIILFVGHVDAQNAKDRIQSIQSALAGSNIQILDTLQDNMKPDVALKNAQDALANHPDLAGMVGIYSYDGPAILAAVRGANKLGEVKIVCFDDDNATMAGVADGSIYGTVVQKPFEFGLQTIIAMKGYLSGDKTRLAAGKILFATRSVTKDNLEAYQIWQNSFLPK